MGIQGGKQGTGPNIVGISAGYHDSACCLLMDGKLVAAVQEERFSRVKNDKSFPRRAFRYCLDAGSISIADLDCVAFYEDPAAKLHRQIWMSMTPGVRGARREALLDRVSQPQPQEQIRTVLGFDGDVEIADHHLSHAASAYYFSGFSAAAILTVDGVGDWPTTTYSRAIGPAIERLEQVDFPHSLGLLYSAITSYLGFEVNEGEYKVMGLAPYGKPQYRAQIERLLEIGSDGQYRLNMQYFAFLVEDAMYTNQLPELFGRPPRAPESELETFHYDVARSMQVVLEDVLLQKLRYLHGITGLDDLCMAGGVALNVVANARCLREGPFKRLFVQPAAGDAGAALGAAALAHVRRSGAVPSAALNGMYLGPANQQVDGLLKRSSAQYADFGGDERGLLDCVVDHLVAGKVVGWSQGRIEFGPRALGARSILADPRVPGMRDRINALVKMREGFRPFAPAVLASEASRHFELDHASPFMLEVCQVRSAIDMPAITHVDGSARVQTVDGVSNPRFAALLQRFFERTDCPVLLNTSFNMRGEPLVCSPYDALMCFVRSGMDLLVLEDCVLERSGIPLLWEMESRLAWQSTRSRAGAVDHLVYTLV